MPQEGFTQLSTIQEALFCQPNYVPSSWPQVSTTCFTNLDQLPYTPDLTPPLPL